MRIPAWERGTPARRPLAGARVSLYVYLPDVDSVVKKAAAEGAKILKPVQDQFYGDRNGFIRDPFGHLWGIATHVEDVSPEQMKERMKKMMPAAVVDLDMGGAETLRLCLFPIALSSFGSLQRDDLSERHQC